MTFTFIFSYSVSSFPLSRFLALTLNDIFLFSINRFLLREKENNIQEVSKILSLNSAFLGGTEDIIGAQINKLCSAA